METYNLQLTAKEMAQEMKAKKCEKCGKVLATNTYVTGRDGNSVQVPYLPRDCPRCNPPALTYGPITVEMVAEMLCQCSECSKEKGSDICFRADGPCRDDLFSQARAVIRLLKWVQYEEQVGPTGFPKAMPADALRTRLLDIAKESR